MKRLGLLAGLAAKVPGNRVPRTPGDLGGLGTVVAGAGGAVHGDAGPVAAPAAGRLQAAALAALLRALRSAVRGAGGRPALVAAFRRAGAGAGRAGAGRDHAGVRFRQRLVPAGLHERLLGLVNEPLGSPRADSSSASRWWTSRCCRPRAAPHGRTIPRAVNPEADHTVKHGQAHHGFKAPVAVDEEHTADPQGRAGPGQRARPPPLRGRGRRGPSRGSWPTRPVGAGNAARGWPKGASRTASCGAGRGTVRWANRRRRSTASSAVCGPGQSRSSATGNAPWATAAGGISGAAATGWNGSSKASPGTSNAGSTLKPPPDPPRPTGGTGPKRPGRSRGPMRSSDTPPKNRDVPHAVLRPAPTTKQSRLQPAAKNTLFRGLYHAYPVCSQTAKCVGKTFRNSGRLLGKLRGFIRPCQTAFHLVSKPDKHGLYLWIT